jgi:hypothetical protein
MLRGLTTVNYLGVRRGVAKGSYAKLLGIEPCFERPGGGSPAGSLA